MNEHSEKTDADAGAWKASLSVRVIRADGTIEDIGTISDVEVSDERPVEGKHRR